jgi:uncharacterized protein YeaC (DUF1315 family)
MEFEQLIAHITPEIHRSLQRAIEIGRWPDGRRLTEEQRALSLQAVIAYEARHVAETERTGYIDRGSKAEGEMCGDEHDHAAESPLKWMQ